MPFERKSRISTYRLHKKEPTAEDIQRSLQYKNVARQNREERLSAIQQDHNLPTLEEAVIWDRTHCRNCGKELSPIAQYRKRSCCSETCRKQYERKYANTYQQKSRKRDRDDSDVKYWIGEHLSYAPGQFVFKTDVWANYVTETQDMISQIAFTKRVPLILQEAFPEWEYDKNARELGMPVFNDILYTA